jgi:hypothetical protein
VARIKGDRSEETAIEVIVVIAFGKLSSDALQLRMGGVWTWPVHRDNKLHSTMNTLRLGKQNYFAWPIVDGLFLAVWAFDLVLVQTKNDKFAFHGISPVSVRAGIINLSELTAMSSMCRYGGELPNVRWRTVGADHRHGKGRFQQGMEKSWTMRASHLRR